MTRRLDYDDAYTTRFDARVTGVGTYNGHPAIELEATYFYPEGGGQRADRGKVGDASVVDVQTEGERIWHLLDRPQPNWGPQIPAEVDWVRRFDHMQQHTGQHILSAAFLHVLGADTQSSHLGEERSTIEVDLADVDWQTVDRIERAANQVVWENRSVQRHWVDDEGVKRFALRKPPQFSGSIRIVEIPDWDVSACGGTHTLRTGEVGAIKIVRWERVRGNLRFEFLCGSRALRDYAWRTESLLEAAKRHTMKDTELMAHLERAADEREALKKRVQELATELAASESRAWVGKPPRPVARFLPTRDREGLKLLAIQCMEAGAPWVVVGAAAPEPGLIAACPRGTQEINLRELVPEALKRSSGKGGGSPDLVTIVAGDAKSAEDAWRWLTDTLEAKLGGNAGSRTNA